MATCQWTHQTSFLKLNYQQIGKNHYSKDGNSFEKVSPQSFKYLQNVEW